MPLSQIGSMQQIVAWEATNRLPFSEKARFYSSLLPKGQRDRRF